MMTLLLDTTVKTCEVQVFVLKEASGLYWTIEPEISHCCWSSWVFYLLYNIITLATPWLDSTVQLSFCGFHPVSSFWPLTPDPWHQPGIFLHTTVASSFLGTELWCDENPSGSAPDCEALTPAAFWAPANHSSPHPESLHSSFRAEFWFCFDLLQVVFTTSAFSCCRVIGWFSICGNKRFYLPSYTKFFFKLRLFPDTHLF